MFPSFNFEKAVTEAEQEQRKQEKIELGEVPRLIFDIKGRGHPVMENGKVAMCRDTKEKVKMYIQMLLRTHLNKYKVYESTGFGTTYRNYRGNNLIPVKFISSEIKRELNEQLSKLNVFDSMIKFDAEREERGLRVEFTVILKSKEKIEMSEVISI